MSMLLSLLPTDSRSDRQPKFDNDPTEFFVCLHAGASELTF
jgi:hypothetical protein